MLSLLSPMVKNNLNRRVTLSVSFKYNDGSSMVYTYHISREEKSLCVNVGYIQKIRLRFLSLTSSTTSLNFLVSVIEREVTCASRLLMHLLFTRAPFFVKVFHQKINEPESARQLSSAQRALVRALLRAMKVASSARS